MTENEPKCTFDIRIRTFSQRCELRDVGKTTFSVLAWYHHRASSCLPVSAGAAPAEADPSLLIEALPQHVVAFCC